MDKQRPRGRQKNVTSGGGVHRRGSGLGTGPVGSPDGYSGRRPSGSSGGGMNRAAKAGGISLPVIIILIVVFLLKGGGSGGGADLSSLTGYGTGGTSSYGSQYGYYDNNSGSSSTSSSQQTTNGWAISSNTTAAVDTEVAGGSRAKYTEILGNGQDVVTIMVYLCGTDLESRSGMATSDLQEMAAADIGDNVNLLVYTGGCRSWRNNVVSSSVNQIYQVKGGGLKRLESDMGTGAMTNKDTLVSFIKWCKQNFPANRNELIFWDHGGGSVSGYGYDEKYSRSGSMNLAAINTALKEAGMKFDFIGFDTCLMATAENALMLNQYADYLIASEETEPGVGWYYTEWLTGLSRNTSMPTLEVGKNIIDGFTKACAQKCPGQKTTLSMIDLAELANTMPDKMAAFSKSISGLISDKNYKQVSDARNGTREFAQTNRIDQVDLVHLAQNMGTKEGEALSEVIQNAVKYNRTSSNMTNAYGLSIYFPYQKVSYVDTVVDTYDAIGMGEEYSQCIREFANLEVSGQVAAGGTGSPLTSLFGDYSGQSVSGGNADMIGQLLTTFLSGDYSSISGLSSGNTGFLTGRSMPTEEVTEYLSENYLDAAALTWEKNADGQPVMKLSDQQWSLVHTLDQNMFYNDGEGYIDLGCDNLYSFDDEDNLIADTDRTWLAINGQVVAYYHMDTVDDGENYCITGRVPALLNGERVNLILVFDNEHPTGYIAGAQTDYRDGETDTAAKNMVTLEAGDTLDFLCDYYSYDREYLDSYMLGEQMTISDHMTISNVDVGSGKVLLTYRFTDIYNQEYWSDTLVY